MKPLQHSELEEHNLHQKLYFERTLKRTMLPVASPYLRRHVDEALRFAGVSANDHILEVGCGMGRYTLILAARGVKVEGLDLSPILLERLRAFNRGRYAVPLHCGDILKPPPELFGRFEVVLGFFVLHHLKDLAAAFTGLAQLLKPGGRMVFLEPNAYNPFYYVQMAITPGMTWQGDGGIVHMRRHRVFRAMESAGIGRLRMTRFGFFPPFLTNRPWGARLEALCERIPIWRSLLPFQLFRGEKP